MSWPAGGFLLVTIGSTGGVEEHRRQPLDERVDVSPSRSGKRAPAAAAARTAAAKASRGRSMTNLRAVSE